MNIIKYTDSEIAKNFALLENHLKQAQSGIDEIFCKDCINKHLILLEGLSEEGMNAGGNSKKYQRVYDFAKEIKDKDYKSKGIDFSSKARQIRKDLFDECPECEEKLSPTKIKAIKKATKDLNNPSTFDNQLNKKTKNNMAEFRELGMVNAGQFAAEGAKYLLDTYPTIEPGKYSKIGKIGGGIVLQAFPMFLRMPGWAEKLLLVSGSNLLADGVVEMIRGVPPVAVVRAGAARAVVGQGAVGKFTGQPNARVFGGRVTATNVPTQYARAGIEAGAQAFEAPEHADLIRVD